MAADAGRVGERTASARSLAYVAPANWQTALNILNWALLILALVTLN
jgi:hypothetical protein